MSPHSRVLPPMTREVERSRTSRDSKLPLRSTVLVPPSKTSQTTSDAYNIIRVRAALSWPHYLELCSRANPCNQCVHRRPFVYLSHHNVQTDRRKVSDAFRYPPLPVCSIKSLTGVLPRDNS